MAGTRWLDEREQRVWRVYLETSQQLWEQLEDDLAAATGMPMPEYEILVRLSEAPDRRLRMSELAQQVVHSRSRLTHTVGRMEARGLVVRRRSENDRRGVLAELTDTGYELLAGAAPAHVASVRRRLFDPLTKDDVAALGRIMRKVADALRDT